MALYYNKKGPFGPLIYYFGSLKSCIRRAILRIAEVRESAVLRPFYDPFSTQKLYNKSYFEAGRSLRNRSLLDVNEDFEDEPDAERALLDDFC